MNKIKNHFRTIVYVFFLVVTIYLFAQGLANVKEAGFVLETFSKTSLALLVLSTSILILGLLKCVYDMLQKIPKPGHRFIRVGLMVLMGILQLYFILYFRNMYLFDNAFVSGAAASLAQTGKVADEAFYYMSVYPNQNAYAVLTMVLWKIGKGIGLLNGQIPILCNILNTICLDIAAILACRIWKMSKPKVTEAMHTMAYLVIFLHPIMYIGTNYYYTIILSMPFMMGLIYLAVKYFLTSGTRDKCDDAHDPAQNHQETDTIVTKKSVAPSWTWVLAGVLLAVGYQLRATVAIVAIAICILLVLQKKWRKGTFLFLLVAVVLNAGMTFGGAKVVGIDTTDSAFPMTHWLMMSLTGEGAHNEEDEKFTASFATREEKKAAVAGRIKEKLSAMSAKDLASLEVAKIKNTFGSGLYSYCVYVENSLRNDGLAPYIFGNHKDLLAIYMQALYLVLLLLAFYETLRSICFKSERSFLLILTMVGAIAFYLLWETSPQYSLPFLFVLLLISLSGFYSVFEEPSKLELMRKGNPFLQTAVCVSLVLLLALLIKKYPLFTRQPQEFRNVATSQMLANEELELRDGILCQSFRTNRPFDRIIFQWRNPDGESDAVYEVKLYRQEMEAELDEKKLIAQTEIIAKGQPYNGATIFEGFSEVPTGYQDYVLALKKTEGSADQNLRFVVYRMGGYDAYPFGEFKTGYEKEQVDMLFLVDGFANKPYTTPARYLTLLGILGVLGLSIFVKIGYNHSN